MEQHRVLIVILSLSLFLAVVLGAGLWLFYPRDGEADPSLAEAAAPDEGRAFDPIEYLRGDDEEPIGLEPTEEAEPEDEIIIVYGEPAETTDGSGQEGSAEGERAAPGPAPIRESGEGIVSSQQPPREGSGAQEPEDRSRGETERVAVSPTRERTASAGSSGTTTTRIEPRSSATTETPVSASRPTNAPRTVTREEFWIQLISSPSRDTVEQARVRLNEWTISGVITSVTINDRIYYRLRVGPYIAKPEAEKFLDWIQDIEGFSDSYVSLVYTQRTVSN